MSAKLLKTSTLTALIALIAAGSVYAQGGPQGSPSLPAVNAGGIAVVDLPASSAESIQLDIKQGRFSSQSVERLTLTAQGIDFRAGSLKGFSAQLKGADFENIWVDELDLNAGAFSFDTFELLNHRRFVLGNPIDASVSLHISQEGLTKFFTNPKTIEKLEKAVAKKTGNFALINFSNPSIKLMGRNQVKLGLTTSVANALGAPMELVGTLGINNGKLAFNNMKMLSNGTQLPVDVASLFQNKLNDMIDLSKIGKNSFVIRANSVNASSKMVDIQGRATLTRLEFGK